MINIPIRLLAEEDRPREKLDHLGRSALTDAELLAILIGSGTKNRSALDVARELLLRCNNDLQALGKFEKRDFCQVAGMGPVRAITLMAALELGRRRAKVFPKGRQTISSSQLAYEQFKVELADLNHEEFWVLCLSSGSNVLAKKRISSGGIAGTVADIRMILRAALDTKATALIVAHNHPSGSLKPSEPDIRLTRKLKEAGEIMDIKLLDHLIVSDVGYYSFADQGLVF